MADTMIGVIGGSGVYDIDGLEGAAWQTVDGPWGAPHPDAAPELEQFAFMVGRHECTQYFTGLNPNNPQQKLEGDLLWLAFYALDGRAIRDEYYSMGGNGEQTRAYDSFAKEWWVTWAAVPGVFSLTPEPKPTTATSISSIALVCSRIG